MEQRRRDAEQRHGLLGDGLRRVVRVAEQAASRQDAALARLDAVEQDLAPARRALGDAHAAFQDEREAAAGLARIEKDAARGEVQRRRFGEQALGKARRHFPEDRKTLGEQAAQGLLVHRVSLTWVNARTAPPSTMEPRSQTAAWGAASFAGVTLPRRYVMSVERVVRIFAGANLFQSGFTGLCPLASMLKRTPWFKSPAPAA
ncbi:MAG: hypothetical protein A3G28_00460 [Betaproteobacteria bacterium RIFCSPLOWO2_12_FULL_68_19]|nr:MAG: hypothetical protein A3G28_00460 [Betaproteobacteria bacterium RIFCSPLOWO2_12_FULL_68_19]